MAEIKAAKKRFVETDTVDWIGERARAADYDYAMSVSAGFGGSNASLVFESGLR